MDPNTTNQIITGLGDIAVFIGVILAIEWVFLPFAIFGMKSKLDGIRAAIERSNNLLGELARQDISTGSK